MHKIYNRTLLHINTTECVNFELCLSCKSDLFAKILLDIANSRNPNILPYLLKLQ